MKITGITKWYTQAQTPQAAQQLLIKMPLWLHMSVGSDKNLSFVSIAFLACCQNGWIFKVVY